MRELLDSRVTEGEIPKLDANIAAVEAGRIEADLALAQADADAAAIELKALVGLVRPSAADPARIARGAGAHAPADAAPHRLTTPPIAARPTSRRRRRASRWRRQASKQARRAGQTDMSLVGNYGREGYGFAQRGFDSAGRLVPVQGNFHSFEIGASLMLPLRNRNQGALASAEAERSGEQELLAARQLAAQAELDAAVVRDREARRAVDMYATEASAIWRVRMWKCSSKPTTWGGRR